MSRPRYRFSPSLLAKWTDFVDSDRIWDEFYGSSEEPAVSPEEFQLKQEAELWDAINRVEREPSEAADKGTCLNEIVDMIVDWRGVKKEGMKVWSNEDSIHAELDGFSFDFDKVLCKRLGDYFSGSVCQYRCEATIETDFGPIILYGDIDYLRRDKVFDLKSTSRYDYGKFEKGWQRWLYPYALIESGDVRFISEFEYTVVKLSNPKFGAIDGEIYRERYDYSHNEAKVRLRAVSEALAAYIEMNEDRIVHPSRVLNEI